MNLFAVDSKVIILLVILLSMISVKYIIFLLHNYVTIIRFIVGDYFYVTIILIEFILIFFDLV